ncbi:MAG: hypothetical protein MJY62_01855 [Bacteroidales bacterium]|nr:hypothetical protein [Bacteroidales bacterium]
MKVNANKVDELNVVLDIHVAAEDYAPAKKKKVSDYRRKAEIKGFRKGMAPASLIEKIYGQQALLDSVNDCIADALNNYIKEEKISIVGEPLPADNQPEQKWEDGNDFDFKFELGLTPKVSLELGKEDELPLYNITVTAAAKSEMKENLLKQYGSLADGKAAGEEDFLIVDFKQGETSVEGAYVALRQVAAAAKADFLGAKVGDVKTVDVNVAFENETDRASMLKVKKEELSAMDPLWLMTVKSVKTFAPAPLTKETFDKIYGEGVVADEAGMDARIEERLKAEYASEADYRLQKDMKDYLVKKSGIAVPETFLKKWITVANEGKLTAEQIESEFPLFIEDYKWQLIRTSLMEKYSVKVEHADLVAAAKTFAAYQYAMYGLNNVPDEQLEEFAKSILASEKDSQRIVEQVENEKVVAAVREVVTLKSKKISVDKFRALK